MVTIIYSDRFLAHQTGVTHPECPARLTAIAQAIKQETWQPPLYWQEPSQREVLPWVKKVHTLSYLQKLQAITNQGGGYLDMDTPLSADSYEVALFAVAGWLDGVDRVLTAKESTFVLSRPPGHHALGSTGMGFCLLSNAAIAAHYALAQPGIQRVGIVDWDVHHGNGTEALVESNPQIAYCSLHQFPFYPGTGQASDRGPHQTVLNIPMKAGSDIQTYQQAFTTQILPFLQNFNPQLIIVSAGYDANSVDPLANMNLQPQDFGQFTRDLLTLTPQLLLGLEGGYQLEALAQSVVETLKPLNQV